MPCEAECSELFAIAYGIEPKWLRKDCNCDDGYIWMAIVMMASAMMATDGWGVRRWIRMDCDCDDGSCYDGYGWMAMVMMADVMIALNIVL